MKSVGVFFRLMGEAFGVFSLYGGVVIFLFVFFIVAVIRNWQSIKTGFKAQYLWIFSPLLVTMLMLLWGTIMHNPNIVAPGKAVSTCKNSIIPLMALFQLLLTGYAIYKMKGLRLLAVSISLFELYYLFGVMLVTILSVMGTYI